MALSVACLHAASTELAVRMMPLMCMASMYTPGAMRQELDLQPPHKEKQ